MSAIRIARSPALQRLRDEGYSVEIRNGSAGPILLIHDVPYVNAQRQVCRGTLVSPLELKSDQAAEPVPVGKHQVWFIGEHPCNPDGSVIGEIQHSSGKQDFGGNVVTDHDFSAKPPNQKPYPNYHAKMTTYVNLLLGPAQHVEPGITAKLFKPYVNMDDSVFKYGDSATSRSGIGAVASKLAMNRIAIIGLGGTGSYLLDLVAKTPAREIHLYDGDEFHQHNAFRAPGAPAFEELAGPKKVDYFAGIYSKMRHGIIPHAVNITAENLAELAGFDFVFVCVDKPVVRKVILEGLRGLGVPFIDAGIDVQKQGEEGLFGQCRVTLGTPEKNDHIEKRISYEQGRVNDLYVSDIQVADLNAMNAVMAVLRWKKYAGFYQDDQREHHSVYTIGIHSLTKDEKA